MALKGDNIKDLFSSKLNSFEPEVPASIWGGIDQLLSQQPPVQAPDSSSAASNTASSAAKTVALKTTLIAAGVAAVVATGVFIAYNYDQQIEVPTIVEEAMPTKTIEAPQTETPIAETTKVLAQADFVRHRAAQPIAVEEAVEVAIAPEVKEEVVVKVAKAVEKVETLALDEAEELPPPALPKFLKEEMSLSVRTNTGGLSSKINDAGGDVLFSKDARSTEFVDVLRNENKDYTLSHKQPISVGLTVSKGLSRKLSLETGLMFTYLSSKISSNSAVNLKEEQTFGYLGIPIYLNYSFYELGKTKFYLSLGAMMQKDVYGKYTSKLINGKELMLANSINLPEFVVYSEPTYIKNNISQSHWQFSSHLTVGASYPIYRKLYIYSSVGGAYYFDANNEYRTVFSDRKFQLDLNLGFRFDF